jgi:hypothetical protein
MKSGLSSSVLYNDNEKKKRKERKRRKTLKRTIERTEVNNKGKENEKWLT